MHRGTSTTDTERFSDATAERFIAHVFSAQASNDKGGEPPRIDVGPDGFPYQMITAEEAGGDVVPIGNVGLSTLLTKGAGLAVLSSGNSRNARWVYKYRDLICYQSFGALRPPPQFDETLYKETLDKPIPKGTQTVIGYPSEQIYPGHVRTVINAKVSKLLGRPVMLDPQLIEYPTIDKLFRLRFNLDTSGLSEVTRATVGREMQWCLPYAIYF
jgi:hypothetical protein